jgi:predicted O-methyltransferase YrrM
MGCEKTLSFEECWNQTMDQIKQEYNATPSQTYSELELLYPYIEELRPKNVLEIGVQFGGSLRFWINALQESGCVIGIDNDPKIPERVKTWQRWLKKGQKLRILNMDSTKNETLKEVLKILGNQKLDFLHIDGDHEMPAPQMDYNNYGCLVRPNGIIAFHDIGGPPEVTQNESLRNFWSQLKKQLLATTNYKTMEFVCRHPTGIPCGFGVIIKSEYDEEMRSK